LVDRAGVLVILLTMTIMSLADAKARMAELHAAIAEYLPVDADASEVVVGIETDRGPWVAALVAAGYWVYAINPLQSPGIGSVLPRREQNPIGEMRMCWPRLSGWIEPTTSHWHRIRS
jgi:hypothetical protein